MSRTLWTAILLIAFNEALANNDPRTGKTCGINATKCFSHGEADLHFKEHIQCLESLMKTPDCEKVATELSSLIKELTSTAASNKTLIDVAQELACFEKDEKAVEFVNRIRNMTASYKKRDKKEKDEMPIELIESLLCCAMPELEKVLQVVQENHCSQETKELFEKHLKPALKFADATVCSSAEKDRCETFFPSTKVEVSA